MGERRSRLPALLQGKGNSSGERATTGPSALRAFGIRRTITSLAVALPAVFAVGLGLSFCFPVLTGALQVFVPDWVRGRVMALHQMANLGSRPFAALGVGVLSAALGVPIALVAGCLLAPLGISVAGYAFRSLDARRPAD